MLYFAQIWSFRWAGVDGGMSLFLLFLVAMELLIQMFDFCLWFFLIFFLLLALLKTLYISIDIAKLAHKPESACFIFIFFLLLLVGCFDVAETFERKVYIHTRTDRETETHLLDIIILLFFSLMIFPDVMDIHIYVLPVRTTWKVKLITSWPGAIVCCLQFDMMWSEISWIDFDNPPKNAVTVNRNSTRVCIVSH